MRNFPQAPKPRIRHLTLLHSNDLHGDFLAETLDNRLVGGVSLLSGYLNKTCQECPNTLYMIAGIMGYFWENSLALISTPITLVLMMVTLLVIRMVTAKTKFTYGKTDGASQGIHTPWEAPVY